MRRKIDVTIPNLRKKGDVQKNEPFEDVRKKRENVENRLFIVVFKELKCQYINILVGDALEVPKI